MLQHQDKPLEEKEYPDEADLADDDEVALLTRCPACGKLIYEDAEKCPHCRQWVTSQQPAGQLWRQSRKWYVRAGLYLTKTFLINWILWLALAALAAVMLLLELMK